MPKKRSLIEILQRFQLAHGDFYDYSLIKEIDKIIKVKIICPIHGIFEQRISDHYNGAGCQQCSKHNRKQTNLIKYGVEYVLQSIEIKDKSKATKLKRYNNEYYNNREKYQETMINLYGSTSPLQIDKFKHKRKQTILKNYGIEEYWLTQEIINKKLKTNIQRYSTSNVFQNESIKEKIKQIHLDNLGVEYPAQDPTVLRKILTNGYKFKDYIFPSGKIVQIQGYEDKALDQLLLENINESEIVVDNNSMPYINYYYDKKDRRYFPDIYIKHLHLIIEVKSTWTWELEKDKTTQKLNATVKKGYNCQLWIIEPSGKIFRKIW